MKESYLSFHHDILCSYRTNCLTFLHITSHSLLECFKHHKTKDFRLSWRTGGTLVGTLGLELEDSKTSKGEMTGRDSRDFIGFHFFETF